MKFIIKTYGCAMNTYESQKMTEKLRDLGGFKTDNLEEADLLIINSCSVRQAAEDSVYGLGKDLSKLSIRPVVILTGCVTGAAKSPRRRYEISYLKKKAPFVDYFLTFDELVRELPNIVGLLFVKTFPIPSLARLNASLQRVKNSGLVPISYGCNNFCSYCIVPYARGPERSRPYEEIRAEVAGLVDKGIGQITLLGQNVNSWGNDIKINMNFSGLLQNIHEITEITKISFLTSNPWDFTDELVETLKLPKIDRYLHLPVQSGNAEVLRRMNRHYNSEEYLTLVNKIKMAVPEITLGTDIIVGFPGETDEQFESTLKLIREVKFKNIFVAMYSPRKGTVAAETMTDDVSRKVKKERHQKVLKLVKNISA